MTINKQLFEDVLSGKLKGTFILRNQLTCNSDELTRNTTGKYGFTHPYCIKYRSYTPSGVCHFWGETNIDIVDFIPDKNMETKELKIEVPEGFEIDKENSSFEKIVFKKKDTKPRSWEEYCKNNEDKQVWFVEENSDIGGCHLMCRPICEDKNTLPTKELAEAFLAYMQLMSLRQAWIHQWSVEQNLTEDWEPDWSNVHVMKYCINVDSGKISIYPRIRTQAPLSFPTHELTEDFMNCFIDLLEIAKPLL